MNNLRKILTRVWPFILMTCIVAVIFYKTVFKGLVPFPADLLLSEYAPWRHTSYFGYNAGAIPSKAQYFDTVRELYPWKTLVIEGYKKNQLPLWNPYNFSGSPLLANYQSQALYPLGLLYLMLPQIIAWSVLIILQPLLGSAFMYLFATEIGLSKMASLIMAVLFNFSSFAGSWLEFNTVWHTILWLPLLLYILERGIKRTYITRKNKIIFIFALFSCITGGHPQDFIYTFLFFLIYTGIRIITFPDLTHAGKLVFAKNQLSLIIIIPFLLASPQLFPTIELFSNSSRVPHDYLHIVQTMLIQWWQIPMLFVQDFFGNPATRSYYAPDTYVGKTLSIGTAGFILALITLFQKNRSWHSRFFLWTSGIILLLTVNTPFSQIFYRAPLPVLSTGTPTRILFLLAFALAGLAGSGFDYAKSMQWKKLIPPVVFTVGILSLLWLVAFIHPTIGTVIINATTSKHALLVTTAVTACMILILFLKNIENRFIYVCIFVITAEMFYSFTKFNPFVPASFVYPPHEVLTFLQTHAGINRFWGYGTTRIESNINAQYHLFSADGTDPLNLSWYNRFIQSSGDGNIARQFTRSTRSDVAIAPGYGERDLPDNAYRLRIMDLLGVQYILDRIDNPKDNFTFSSDHFKSVFSTSDGYTVYENIRTLPRAFLADKYVTYSNDTQFERIFFDPDLDLKNTIILPASGILPEIDTAKQKSVQFNSYTPNEIRLSTSSDARQLLFLSDTYANGWHATVDNNPVHIYIADYAFRAIAVPAGNHEVRFFYYPDSFRYGLFAGVIGLCLFILVLCGFPLTKRKNH